jgi:hypothetical protein
MRHIFRGVICACGVVACCLMGKDENGTFLRDGSAKEVWIGNEDYAMNKIGIERDNRSVWYRSRLPCARGRLCQSLLGCNGIKSRRSSEGFAAASDSTARQQADLEGYDECVWKSICALI